jgi:hypothetical protein
VTLWSRPKSSPFCDILCAIVRCNHHEAIEAQRLAVPGGNALLQGRIQTRVVQAVGRCTRSLLDYSAVVVTGGELTDYLNSPVKLSFLHPELQAELDFGARQSINASLKDLVENFDIFLRNDAAWEAVNRQILAKRAIAAQANPSGVGQLQTVVIAEINYQKNLWQRHYEGAVENAGQVLAGITDPSLQGYRALWNYLAGAAAAYGEASGVAAMGVRARIHFAAARDAPGSIRWLALHEAVEQTFDLLWFPDKLALDCGQHIVLVLNATERGRDGPTWLVHGIPLRG